MGGILGLWHRDGRPVDASLLPRLRATLAHRRDVAVLRVAASGTHVAFDGRLDNREELLDRLALRYDVDSRASDSALVQAAYREWDRGFAAHLNGDFVTAVLDGGQRLLLLARDALGVRPLYYYATESLVVFASEIKAIIAHPAVVTRPDDDVLADYVFNLLAAGDDCGVTFFTGVRAVRPSHVVAVGPDRVDDTRYWDFDPSRRLPIRTIDEAAEGFREHFTRAVRRRLRPVDHAGVTARTPDPVAISVSGGLDSSAIFCTASGLVQEDGGPPLIGCSYIAGDGMPSDEKQYLADIERMYGGTIHRWGDLPAGVVAGSRDGVRHLEVPALDARWTGTLAYYRAIAGSGARTLLTGHWGDQFLVEDGFLVDLLRRGRWIRAWRDGREFARWQDDGAGAVARTLSRAFLR
jgi:asparagine synthase (glutamine-hydrolysing)